MIKLLLEYNANPNMRNSLGRTPLHFAVQSNSVDCIKILREYGADPEIHDSEYQRPLDLSNDFRLSEALQECKAIYLTSKSEDISEIESGHVLSEFFDTFGGNLQSALRDSKRIEKPILMDWLLSINLTELYGIMVDSGYDDHIVMARQMLSSMPITENNLKEIGIAKPGNRKKLLFYLEEEGKRKNIRIKDNSIAAHSKNIRDWLDDLDLDALYNKFLDSGYDDYIALVKMVPTRWALNEQTLREEICIKKEDYIVKILQKLQNDYLLSINDGIVFYEDPKNVACSKCYIY